MDQCGLPLHMRDSNLEHAILKLGRLTYLLDAFSDAIVPCNPYNPLLDFRNIRVIFGNNWIQFSEWKHDSTAPLKSVNQIKIAFHCKTFEGACQIQSMTTRVCCDETVSPSRTSMFFTDPDFGAFSSFCIFIASMISKGCPS